MYTSVPEGNATPVTQTRVCNLFSRIPNTRDEKRRKEFKTLGQRRRLRHQLFKRMPEASQEAIEER